ncbi:unnamed protein product [Blepharisma stoltei]|uniref:Uncharacterized protein n=1 Tax=Blepharisma stoltei TaxID=1481888 RepID=A0AAU9JL46_9CILI|nr:unnamed protein product [Blepharisma stoltei]
MAKKVCTNFFINDPCYYQDSFLGFLEKSQENSFSTDLASIHTVSFQSILAWLILINCSLYACGWHIHSYVVAIFVILSIFLYFMKYDRYLTISLYGEILCTIFQFETIETGSLLECLGAFFPDLLINILGFKRWILFFIFSLLKSGIFYFTNAMQFKTALFTIISYSIFNYFIEKEKRTLWVLYHSYKKSYELHDDMFMFTPNGIFVVDEDMHILYHNNKAADITYLIGRAKLNRLDKFEDMFDDDHRNHVKKLALEALNWNKKVEEIIIKKKDYESDNIVTLRFTFDRIEFKGKKCLKIVFMNISNIVFQDTFISICYKNILESIERFTNKLFESYRMHTNINQHLLTEIYSIQHRLRTFFLMQCKFLSKIEIKKDYFDLQVEILNTIEAIFMKAAKRDLIFSLSTSKDIPNCIIGDKKFHNYLLYAVLDFAIKNSNENSVIFISVSMISSSNAEIIVKYVLQFPSLSITQDELDRIFQIREQASKRKTLNDMISIQHRYGSELIMFDSLVCLMRGYTDAKFSESICTIAINLPLIVSERKAASKLELITGCCLQESDNEYIWKYKNSANAEFTENESEDYAMVHKESQLPKYSSLKSEIKEWRVLLLCNSREREKSIKNILKKSITKNIKSVNSAALGLYLYEKEAKKGQIYNAIFIDFQTANWEKLFQIKDIKASNEQTEILFYGIIEGEDIEDSFIKKFDGVCNFYLVKFPIDIGTIKNVLRIKDS